MAASSAPAVKSALMTLLQQDSGLSGVQVSYSHPGAAIQQESIYFLRTIGSEAAAALGQKRRDEDYDLEVVVDVARDGDQAQAAETRCWALVAEIENVVRANPAMGNVSGWVVFTAVEMTPYTEAGQQLAEAICKVHVKHRK